jgi:uncharacterized membrane protein YeiH
MDPTGLPTEFLLPPFFDYGATFVWAVSGALVGARKGYDIVGGFLLALAASTGGGLLRDGLFLQQGPPALVRSAVYLQLIVAAAVLVWFFGRYIHEMERFKDLLRLVDAAGLGAFAVVGMNRASAAGLSVLGVILVGLVNAVGGGLLRDVIARREPDLLRPGTLQALAVLAGCLVFLALTGWGRTGQTPAAWTAIAVVFVLRALSPRFGLRTRPQPGFEEYWKPGDPGEGI